MDSLTDANFSFSNYKTPTAHSLSLNNNLLSRFVNLASAHGLSADSFRLSSDHSKDWLSLGRGEKLLYPELYNASDLSLGKRESEVCQPEQSAFQMLTKASNLAAESCNSYDAQQAINVKAQRHSETGSFDVNSRLNAPFFSSPLRRISEPHRYGSNNFLSGVVDQESLPRPQSCCVSPVQGVNRASFQGASISTARSFATNGSPCSDSSPSLACEEAQLSGNPSEASDSNRPLLISMDSVMLSQSSLQDFVLKSASAKAFQEAQQSGVSSQLYLLVPSNYPVLMSSQQVLSTADRQDVEADSQRKAGQDGSASSQLLSNWAHCLGHGLDGAYQRRGGNHMAGSLKAESTETRLKQAAIALRPAKSPLEPVSSEQSEASTRLSCKTSKRFVRAVDQLSRPPLNGVSSSSQSTTSGSVSDDCSPSLPAAGLQSTASSSLLQPLRVDAVAQPPRLRHCEAKPGDANRSLHLETPNSSSDRSYMRLLGIDSKDFHRRASHNEVERRRRDRINTWIAELHKLLPREQQAKSQYQSKGVVLKRVCEYFQCVNRVLAANDNTLKQLQDENLLLKKEVRRLKRDKQLLYSVGLIQKQSLDAPPPSEQSAEGLEQSTRLATKRIHLESNSIGAYVNQSQTDPHSPNHLPVISVSEAAHTNGHHRF